MKMDLINLPLAEENQSIGFSWTGVLGAMCRLKGLHPRRSLLGVPPLLGHCRKDRQVWKGMETNERKRKRLILTSLKFLDGARGALNSPGERGSWAVLRKEMLSLQDKELW